MESNKLRIATWNVQRPESGDDARLPQLAHRLRSMDADIWILTETHQSLSPGLEYRAAFTRQMRGKFHLGECRTAIWSRLPIAKTIATHDPETAVCVEVTTDNGAILVYGTVIPYHQAGVGQRTYRSGGVDVTGMQPWQLHYESIDRHLHDLMSISQRHPDHPICFGGDFNQSRDGRKWGGGRQWYGTEEGRRRMTDCLNRMGLHCVTETDFVAAGAIAGRSNVDHLCVSQALVQDVALASAWNADLLEGGPVSDHSGVFIDLCRNQRG